MSDDLGNMSDAAVVAMLKANAKTKKEIEITDEVIGKFHPKTIPGVKSDQLYIWDSIYRPNGEAIIKAYIEQNYPRYAKNNTINEIISRVKRKTFTDRATLQNASKNLICFDNGNLDIKTRELKPHTPEIGFISKIPVTYDPKATCPKTSKVVADILHPDDVPAFAEWLGFTLYRVYFLKKALILVGDHDSGKTTIINIITNFHGLENISTETLERLNNPNSNFSTSNLEGKNVNINDDLSYNDIKSAGEFKKITGGGALRIEKKFQDSYGITNWAKLINTCNQIPKIKTVDDDAYFSRWDVRRCTNEFTEENRDEFILDKTNTDSEKSGLLNLALDGLDRLLKARKFTGIMSLSETKAVMMESAEPFLKFIKDILIEKDDGVIEKDDLYKVYKGYAHKNNIPILTHTKLTQELKRLIPSFDTARIKRSGKQVQCYKGVFWNPEIATKSNVAPFAYLLSAYMNIFSKYDICLDKNPANPDTQNNPRVPLFSSTILGYIRKLGEVDSESIANAHGQSLDDTLKFLEKLSGEGSIIQVKPNRWRILE